MEDFNWKDFLQKTKLKEFFVRVVKECGGASTLKVGEVHTE
jgi:hypothetical protein